MTDEQLRSICRNAIQTITKGLAIPLGDAVAKAVCDSYNQGWEDCKTFFNIKDEDYLKES